MQQVLWNGGSIILHVSCIPNVFLSFNPIKNVLQTSMLLESALKFKDHERGHVGQASTNFAIITISGNSFINKMNSQDIFYIT